MSSIKTLGYWFLIFKLEHTLEIAPMLFGAHIFRLRIRDRIIGLFHVSNIAYTGD